MKGVKSLSWGVIKRYSLSHTLSTDFLPSWIQLGGFFFHSAGKPFLKGKGKVPSFLPKYEQGRETAVPLF